MGRSPPCFLGAAVVAFIGEEVVASGQQERAELALAAVHVGEEVFLQQAGEELLR